MVNQAFDLPFYEPVFYQVCPCLPNYRPPMIKNRKAWAPHGEESVYADFAAQLESFFCDLAQMPADDKLEQILFNPGHIQRP